MVTGGVGRHTTVATARALVGTLTSNRAADPLDGSLPPATHASRWLPMST